MKLKELLEGNENTVKRPTVFVDMDGVLADMFNYAAELHDVEHYNSMTDDQWNKFLKDSDAYHLFRNLPAFDTCNELLRIVIKYAGSYKILSSPLSFDRSGSIKGKKEWIREHLSILPEQEIFEHDKWKYAVNADGSPNVLIDDWKVNTRAWDAAGGIAIKYQADESPVSLVETELQRIFHK